MVMLALKRVGGCMNRFWCFVFLLLVVVVVNHVIAAVAVVNATVPERVQTRSRTPLESRSWKGAKFVPF